MSDTVPAVKALVERDGKVLGLKIKAGEEHMWTLPGGTVEHGEDPGNALHMKISNQLGLEVTPGEPFGVYHYFTGPDGDQVVVTVFSCSSSEGSVDVNTDTRGVVDYQWLEPSSILEKNLNQDLKEVLKQRLEREAEKGEEDEEKGKAGEEEEKDELPKLVRDNIPGIIEDDGGDPVVEQVEDSAMPELLRDKILEEARELHESGDLEEVADIYEALDRYLDVLEAHEEMDYIRAEKEEERGVFDENLVLEEK
ncbi:MAG: NUDIX domain-containing protein [Candidatus Nanohaloarchaea archaeon]